MLQAKQLRHYRVQDGQRLLLLKQRLSPKQQQVKQLFLETLQSLGLKRGENVFFTSLPNDLPQKFCAMPPSFLHPLYLL